ERHTAREAISRSFIWRSSSRGSLTRETTGRSVRRVVHRDFIPRGYRAPMTRTLLAMLLITIPAYAEAGPCPTAVSGAVGKAFPRATITSCKAEHEHGKDSYEVKVTKASGEKIEVDVAPDGAILQVEESIALDAVPDAVKKAFAARYPKARPTGADK